MHETSPESEAVVPGQEDVVGTVSAEVRYCSGANPANEGLGDLIVGDLGGRVLWNHDWSDQFASSYIVRS